MYPLADIYVHVADEELCAREFPNHRIRTTFISKLPFARRYYQKYLPLMPMALEELDLREYDLVISSESGPAKGVLVAPHAKHVCYCHSPMRYVWDMYPEYRSTVGGLMRMAWTPISHYLRMWDQLTAQRVDHFAANSSFVAARIRKYYQRDSVVIFPPVDVEVFNLSPKDDGFYLSVGQLVPYKRPNLLIDAFNASGKKLLIIGDGPMLAALRRRAKSNVELVGSQPFEVIRDSYSKCKALVFPGVEDFGMVPVEAMASGKPVIAFKGGGALETVVDEVTGVFFDAQSAESLNAAISRFEALESRFDAIRIREHARKFSSGIFLSTFKDFIDDSLARRY